MRPIEKRSTNSNVVGRRSDRVASPDFVARHRTHVWLIQHMYIYIHTRRIYWIRADHVSLSHTSVFPLPISYSQIYAFSRI